MRQITRCRSGTNATCFQSPQTHHLLYSFPFTIQAVLIMASNAQYKDNSSANVPIDYLPLNTMILQNHYFYRKPKHDPHFPVIVHSLKSNYHSYRNLRHFHFKYGFHSLPPILYIKYLFLVQFSRSFGFHSAHLIILRIKKTKLSYQPKNHRGE